MYNRVQRAIGKGDIRVCKCSKQLARILVVAIVLVCLITGLYHVSIFLIPPSYPSSFPYNKLFNCVMSLFQYDGTEVA